MKGSHRKKKKKLKKKKEMEVGSHTLQNLAKQYRHLSRRQSSIKKLSKKDYEQPMYKSQHADLKFGYHVHQERPLYFLLHIS